MDVVIAILVVIAFVALWRGMKKFQLWEHRRSMEVQAETALRNEMAWASAQQRAADKILRNAGETP